MRVYQNILITGASSGIGEALALYYAKEGAKCLFICGRNAKRLDSVAARCRDLGAQVYAKILDITDEKATAAWIAECQDKAPLHLVFANAGVSTTQEVSENIRRTFATNVGGVVNTVLPAIEIMQKAPKKQPKHIVITASIAGYHGLPACPSYSASKACVKAWGEALRIDLGKRYGIRVSTLAPGFVRSRITDKNTCPMPFFMEADKAAELIAKRVDRNVGLIAFPCPMRLGAWVVSILPNALSDLIYRWLPYKV